MLLALGINHKSAPVTLRERLAFNPDALDSALQDLHGTGEIREAAILSTCNRTEIYCGEVNGCGAAVVDWLGHYHGLPVQQIEPYLYRHEGPLAVKHILRVAAGLDSMILGEPQILGQIKTAYRLASTAGTLGTLLNRLFQHTFAVAKQVRTDTSIGASPVSVAFASVSLSRQIFADLRQHTAMLIGAGETIELVTRHFHEQGIGRVIVANRTLERAHALASQFGGYAVNLNEIPQHLAEADIVISATASPTTILQRPAVEAALRQRRQQPMFMVDIAVPRDIDPTIAELEDVYLYSVDDLQDIIQENLRSRQAAAEQAEEIIAAQVEHFMGWLRTRDSADSIRALRQQAEATRDAVQQQALRRLERGESPAEVLQFLARTLTNKLIHSPSAELRQASSEGREDIVELIQQIYRLNHRRETPP